MTQAICIIGTDTEIGKTYTLCQILKYLVQNGHLVAGLKPIACGTIATEFGPLNQDVYNMFMASNVKLEFKKINPICFSEPIAPHIAAVKHKVKLNVANVIEVTHDIIRHNPCDYLLIEGVGGLLVPLNVHETYLDLLTQWSFPVILVVGMRLGCLNHALLTYSSLVQNKIKLLGWIANYIDPQMAYSAENLQFLTTKLNTPLLAVIPHGDKLKVTPNFLKVFI